MRRILFMLVTMWSISIQAQVTLIPDASFEQELIDLNIDSDGVVNGQVFTADIAAVIELDLNETGITDLTGIQDFSSLEKLEATYTFLSVLDLSSNTNLKYLDLNFSSDLYQLDVTANANLEFLNCSNSGITEIDLSQNTSLEILYIGNPNYDVGIFNDLTELDLTNNLALKELYCPYLYTLNTLDLSQNVNLEVLDVVYCNLTALNLSNNLAVRSLWLGELNAIVGGISNNFQTLDLSSLINLSSISLDNTNISELNLQNGNNDQLSFMRARTNPSLLCIQVDDAIAANNNEPPYSTWLVDNQISYSKNCSFAIEDFWLNTSVIYPNPAANDINVTGDVDRLKYQVFNSLGVVLKHGVFEVSSKLNIEDLSAGLYFLQLENFGAIKFVKR